VSVVIATTDAMVSLVDTTESYGTINAGAISLIDNAFSFTVADNVPDQHTVSFEMIITDTDGHTWNTAFNVLLNAPSFTIESMLTIDDATGNNDGILDAGETADIRIQTTNDGHASITNVMGAIISTSTDITINTATTSAISMGVGETQEFVFNVTANDDAVNGTAVVLDYTVTGGVSNQYTNAEAYEFTIGFIPEYCAAGSDNTTDEFIQNVQFVTIDNSSTQGPDYSDYTSISTDIMRGESYPITITNGEHFSSDQMGCWIDWNYDGDFNDANESFTIDYTDPTGIGTITVPEDARLGATRMRLRVLYSGEISPCGNASYGEVEDYTVNVQALIGTSDFNMERLNVYPNPNQGTFTVDFRQVNASSDFEVNVYNINGQLVYHTNTTQSKIDINLAGVSGIYFLTVTSGEQVLNRKLIIQ